MLSMDLISIIKDNILKQIFFLSDNNTLHTLTQQNHARVFSFNNKNYKINLLSLLNKSSKTQTQLKYKERKNSNLSTPHKSIKQLLPNTVLTAEEVKSVFDPNYNNQSQELNEINNNENGYINYENCTVEQIVNNNEFVFRLLEGVITNRQIFLIENMQKDVNYPSYVYQFSYNHLNNNNSNSNISTNEKYVSIRRKTCVKLYNIIKTSVSKYI